MCSQNSPKIRQKFIASISFSTGIVDIDPFLEDFTQSVNIFGHYMPFLSLIYSWGQELPMFLQSCLTFNGGVKSVHPTQYYSIESMFDANGHICRSALGCSGL